MDSNKLKFDEQAVCDVCCGQNGKGSFDFSGDYICYDCALGFDADNQNQHLNEEYIKT